MKCAVAIVLALIGMAIASPAPSLGGLAYSPLLLSSPVEVRSSFVNHGISVPVIKQVYSVPIVKPIIAPIIKTPIIAPIIKSPLYGGYGYGLH